jgi:hypothetical protein
MTIFIFQHPIHVGAIVFGDSVHANFTPRKVIIKDGHMIFTSPDCYTAFHIKLTFFELDYTASAKCRFRHFAPFNGQSSSKKGTFDEKRYICVRPLENNLL